MPGYWFLYNLYALARNSWKYIDRDKRTERIQHLEYGFLAPDTINEMFTAMELLEEYTGKAYLKSTKKSFSPEDARIAGKQLLNSNNKIVNELEIVADKLENSKRKTILIKVLPAYKIYEDLVTYYGTTQLLAFIKENPIQSLDELNKKIPAKLNREKWINIGGQLIPEAEVANLKSSIKSGKIKSWDQVHEQYKYLGSRYSKQKSQHALASLLEISGNSLRKMNAQQFNSLLTKAVATKEWLTKGIHDSRAKDYSNPYRKMVYESVGEMNQVIGKLEDNSFIKDQIAELNSFKVEIALLKKKFKLKP
jgi:hypothetical protein